MSDNGYTYEERLRMALFRAAALLDHSAYVKFRREIRTLAGEGPPIVGPVVAKVRNTSRLA